jgi:uncharacterized protein (TIGR03000 family)
MTMRRFLVPILLLSPTLLVGIAATALAQGRGQTTGQATIIVRLPPDATLVVGSTQTQQRGSERRFVTPDLVPGYTYSYAMEATWRERGKEVRESRTATFRPGQTVVVDFFRRERLPMPKTDKKAEPKADAKKKAEPIPAGKKVEKKTQAPKVEKKADPKPVPPKTESKIEKKSDTKVDAEGFVSLFNGKDLSGWKFEPAKAESAFSVEDGVIVVKGQPAGYFYTDKSYKNYVLRFDWKFVKDGNSGLLVHITGGHKVWPKSVEVQGLQSQHGHIFAIGGAKGDFKTDKEAQKKAIKMGDWNTTEVVSRDGALTAKVNGVQVSTGKSDLTEGPFGLQSEGTQLHFKNIRIKTLE